MLNGYKTLAVGVASIIGGIATANGVGIDAAALVDKVETAVGGCMAAYGIVMIVLRAVTKTPMLDK